MSKTLTSNIKVSLPSGIEASYEDWYIKPYKDPAASEKKWAKNEELEPTPGTVNFFLVGLQVEFEMHSIFQPYTVISKGGVFSKLSVICFYFWG